MWELDQKESWLRKNTFKLWGWRTLESPLYWKEIKPVHPKGNQPWIFTGRTDAEAEAPTLWPGDTKSWLTGKDPNVGKDWGNEEKGAAEHEMLGWHHWFQWTWANSGRKWRTDEPGVLLPMGSQRVKHDLATKQQQLIHGTVPHPSPSALHPPTTLP